MDMYYGYKMDTKWTQSRGSHIDERGGLGGQALEDVGGEAGDIHITDGGGHGPPARWRCDDVLYRS